MLLDQCYGWHRRKLCCDAQAALQCWEVVPATPTPVASSNLCRQEGPPSSKVCDLGEQGLSTQLGKSSA